MGLSWTKSVADFKSPVRVVTQVLWRSRQSKARKCQRLKRELDEARWVIARKDARLQRQQEQICELRRQLQRAEIEKEQIQARLPCRLPDDPPLKGHKFGERMICLALNLARTVGLRPTERVLKIIWEWLGVQQPPPDWTTIRTWLQRVGIAALDEPMEPADDWIWMADHSNQIGPEKALVVLGVRASQLPPPGETLKQEDVRLLTVQPGTAWKREDMAAVYGQLAEASRCLRDRSRIGPSAGRASAYEHRDSRIDVRPVQTTGTPTLQRRLHQLARRFRRAAQNSDQRKHPPGLRHDVGQRRSPMDPRAPRGHPNLKTPSHVQ